MVSVEATCIGKGTGKG